MLFLGKVLFDLVIFKAAEYGKSVFDFEFRVASAGVVVVIVVGVIVVVGE